MPLFFYLRLYTVYNFKNLIFDFFSNFCYNSIVRGREEKGVNRPHPPQCPLALGDPSVARWLRADIFICMDVYSILYTIVKVKYLTVFWCLLWATCAVKISGHAYTKSSIQLKSDVLSMRAKIFMGRLGLFIFRGCREKIFFYNSVPFFQRIWYFSHLRLF